jgi:RHS repeat-associated protein
MPSFGLIRLGVWCLIFRHRRLRRLNHLRQRLAFSCETLLGKDYEAVAYLNFTKASKRQPALRSYDEIAPAETDTKGGVVKYEFSRWSRYHKVLHRCSLLNNPPPPVTRTAPYSGAVLRPGHPCRKPTPTTTPAAGNTGTPDATAAYYAQDGIGNVSALLSAGTAANQSSQAGNTFSTTGDYSSGTYPGSQLKDGVTVPSNGTGWVGVVANGAALTVTLPSAAALDHVVLYAVSNYLPSAFVVEINQNGSWIQVASGTNTDFAASGDGSYKTTKSFTPQSATALRVRFTGAVNSGFVWLTEAEVWSAAATAITQRFDAWGNVTQASGTIPTYGYTGREPDASGLIFYRARYYHPGLGRFASRDPIGMRGGINSYAYAGGNPVNYNDPSGLLAQNAVNSVQNYFGNPLVQDTMSTIGTGAKASILNFGSDVINGGASWLEQFTHSQDGAFGRVDSPVTINNPIEQQVANDLRDVMGGILAVSPVKYGGAAASESEIMQGLVDSANAKFAANPSAAARQLSIGEQRAVQANPGLTPMFYGTALEREVAANIEASPGLKNTFENLSRPGAAVPDFRSTATGATFDITTNTPRSFADHLARPYGQGLNILPYDRPQGFTFP